MLDTLNDDVVSSPQPQSQLLLLVLIEVEVESVGVDVSLDVLDDVMVELVESVLVSVSVWTTICNKISKSKFAPQRQAIIYVLQT